MKLIKLQDKFILVSDEPIKESDYKYHYVTGIRKALVNGNYNNQFKIIAGIPELPEINFSLLSEEDCKIIGFVDVEKLMNSYCSYLDDGGDRVFHDYGVKCLINELKSKSLNNKMFSLEDIKLLIKRCQDLHPKNWEDEIQSLQQTSWDVKVEMESNIDNSPYSSNEFNNKLKALKTSIGFDMQPKITNNSVKIVKIL